MNAVYRRIYQAARPNADQVIFVSEHSHRSKASAEDIASQRFVEKRSLPEASAFLQETAIPGEIILLKSSAGMHLERLMLAQIGTVRCWEEKCGRDICVRLDGAGCGLYSVPFDQHGDSQQRKRLRQELGLTPAL
jgi:UDP-N-acetylmuramoyl-tripeptide--D-alanyl-D-alanine ligase